MQDVYKFEFGYKENNIFSGPGQYELKCNAQK